MPVEVSTQARARGMERLQTSQVAEEVSATLLFLSPLVPSIDAFIDAICIARLGVWPTSEFIDDIAVGVAYQWRRPRAKWSAVLGAFTTNSLSQLACNCNLP